MNPEERDVMMWKFHPFGMFSRRSFCSLVDSIVARNIVGSTIGRRVWKGLAPLRVELLVWFVFQGSLNTKDKLSILNIIPPVATVCLMCSSVAKSIKHTFFKCVYSWRMWIDSLCWCDILWCYLKDPMAFFACLMWC